VAAPSKAWVCGRSLAGNAAVNPARVMDMCLSLVSVVFCQVDVSATDRPLVQRSPTECGASESNLETSTMRKRSPTRGCRTMKIYTSH